MNTMPEQMTPQREPFAGTQHLLLLVLATLIVFLLRRFGLLPPNTTGTPTTKWRGEREIDVLL